MFRLPPKSEVDKRRAEEHRQRMEQELRIEERTEVMRETLADEEAALSAFRTNRLTGIQEEIASKEAKRDELDAELKRLAAEHAVLTQPIEVLWKEVSKLGPEAELKIHDAIERERVLNEKAQSLEEQQQEIARKLSTAERLEEKAISNKEKADRTLSKAQAEADRVKSQATILLEHAKLKDIELREIANSLSDKDEELGEREHVVAERESKLAEREESLKASWDLLQKTAARLTTKK